MRRRSTNRPIRYEVKNVLTILRGDLLTAIDRWRVTARIRTEDGWRARRPAELPDHVAADWRVLRREIDHMRQTLDDLALLADLQIDRLVCGCTTDIDPADALAGTRLCRSCRPTNATQPRED